MFDAAPAPAEALHPDPDRAMPPQLGKVLAVVRTLITRGRNLAAALQRHPNPSVLRHFIVIASLFATADVAAILASIERGLLRAAALEERLRRRAARALELKVTPTRLPRSKQRTAKPAAPPQDPAPALATPLTTEQILAHDRRRPVGAVLVEICRDLGILSGQLGAAMDKDLRLAVMLYGGSLQKLVLKRGWRLSDGPIPTNSARQPTPEPSSPIAADSGPDPLQGENGPAPLKPPALARGSSREADRWGRGPGP